MHLYPSPCKLFNCLTAFFNNLLYFIVQNVILFKNITKKLFYTYSNIFQYICQEFYYVFILFNKIVTFGGT